MKEQINRNNFPPNARIVPDEIRVKPCSLKEICGMYDNMSEKTMRACLSPIKENIGPKKGRLYTVRQVEIILNYIGLPYTVKEV